MLTLSRNLRYDLEEENPMKNQNIAKVLKQYRKLNEYSVEDVATKLQTYSLKVATKTIYGWESGQSQPDADTLLILCDIYHIDNILETFGYSEAPAFRCTQLEKKLVCAYRSHPEMQSAVNRLLEL